jgi:hypothetical protein
MAGTLLKLGIRRAMLPALLSIRCSFRWRKYRSVRAIVGQNAFTFQKISLLDLFHERSGVPDRFAILFSDQIDVILRLHETSRGNHWAI